MGPIVSWKKATFADRDQRFSTCHFERNLRAIQFRWKWRRCSSVHILDAAIWSPTRSLKTLVRFTMTYISTMSSSDCPGCLPERSVPSEHSDNLDLSDRYVRRDPAKLNSRTKLSKWAGRVLATLFARNFGARPGCPASDHPLTLGVRPSLGPLRWSKQAETWPDPRTSWVASGFYLCWALTN